MTQLRPDAAYIRTKPRAGGNRASTLSDFDEAVCEILVTAHTVTSVARTITSDAETAAEDLEPQVAASMHRLLEAERIELSPDS